MKKRKTVALGVVGAFILAIVVAGMIFVPRIQSALDGLVNMKIEDVDLTRISDGTYEGAFSVFPVSVEVQVTISNHAVSSVELVKHVSGQGGSAEVLVDQVVERQSTDLDVISGATYSSKVILKAIENALTGVGR